VTHEFNVDVANKVDVNIRGEDIYCPGADVMLFGDIDVDLQYNEINRNVQWTLPNDELKDWEQFKPVELIAADVSVTLTATISFSNASSCTSSKTFEVKLGNPPTLSLTDTMIYIPKGINFPLEVEAPDYTYYKWEASGSSQAPSLPQWPDPVSPVELPSPNAPYILTLTLINASGCETKQNIYVDYALDLLIPNVFTPNSREPNNTWKFREIHKWTDIFDIQVNVFSRNGALVYSAKGYNNSEVVWDGRRNGENVPIGTYYYIVKLVPKSSLLNTPVRTITGWVMIMR
jgi:gliding motility-associated-like protein